MCGAGSCQESEEEHGGGGVAGPDEPPVLSPAQVLPLLLAGECDFNDAVVRAADAARRRLEFDPESEPVHTALYALLLGTPKHLQAATPLARRVSPARVSLRAKIMQQLCRSVG
jgi:hypothetical protein